MRILGIDPGYDRVGLAIIEKNPKTKEVVIFSKCLQTSAKDEIYTRLLAVGREVATVLDDFKPDAMAIENLFITKNQKTAMRVSEARGIIIYGIIIIFVMTAVWGLVGVLGSTLFGNNAQTTNNIYPRI